MSDYFKLVLLLITITIFVLLILYHIGKNSKKIDDIIAPKTNICKNF